MSTNITVLHAKVRNTNGSPAARRVRAEGQLPAVAYGKEITALAVAVDPKEVHKVLTSDHGKNSVVKLEVEGKNDILAMVKSFQVHPVSRKLVNLGRQAAMTPPPDNPCQAESDRQKPNDDVLRHNRISTRRPLAPSSTTVRATGIASATAAPSAGRRPRRRPG
ncbi:MAG: hypothetical protein EBZ89_09105 [Chloroflexi bacterium]|nr:hypothetical protein [Chloroflexota bacterium]